MKKIISLIAVVLVLLSNTNKITDSYIKYHPLASQAELAFYEGDYKKSILFYEKAFLIAAPFVNQNRNDYYMIAKAYFCINSQQKFNKYLQKAFSIGLFPELVFEDSVLLGSKYLTIKEKTIKAYKSFSTNFDKKMRSQIANALEKDQKYRLSLTLGTLDSVWLDSLSMLSKSSQDAFISYIIRAKKNAPKATVEQIDSINNLQIEVDNENFNYFSKYIETNGFPAFNKIGEMQNNLYAILLHFPSEYKKGINTYWIKSIDLGSISPYSMAQLIDDAYMELGETPIYGIPKMMFNPNLGIMEKIKYNTQSTDNLRAKIGLCSMQLEEKIDSLKNETLFNN